MTSSSGAMAKSGTFGHELRQRSREVFDGHSKRWSRVTRLCQVRILTGVSILGSFNSSSWKSFNFRGPLE